MKIVVEYDKSETNSVKELIEVYNRKLGEKERRNRQEGRRRDSRSRKQFQFRYDRRRRLPYEGESRARTHRRDVWAHG